MPVDPRYFAPANIGQAYEQGLARYEHRQDRMAQQEDKKRLADLLPRATKGDQQAIDELAGLNPDLYLKLDERQRALASQQTGDLAAAVRWADNPEKWNEVIDFYGSKGLDLSQYRNRFDLREQAMLRLGKLGEYLQGAPKKDLVVIDGVAIDKATGQPQFESPYDRIIPGANGSFYRVPRMGIGRGGQQQPKPLTDEDIARMDGGQTGSPPSGGFPR